MRIMDACLPCVVNQALKAADAAGVREKAPLMRSVFTYLAACDLSRMSTPEVMGGIFRMVKEHTGNPDPYRAARRHYDEMFLALLPGFREQVHAAEDPFRMAIRYAILGNIIDFSPMHNTLLSEVEACFRQAADRELTIDDSDSLKRDILSARNVLYLGDNCGEIALDRLMLEMIREMNPQAWLWFGVRGEPVVNDVTMEDASIAGLENLARVIDNGDDSLGTVLHRVSPRFKQIYDRADVVIAKGQGNYESLSEEKKNIYFLLMAKCPAIANAVGVPERSLVCRHLG